MDKEMNHLIENQELLVKYQTNLFMLGLKMHELVTKFMPLYFYYQKNNIVPLEELNEVLKVTKEIYDMYKSNQLPNSQQILDEFEKQNKLFLQCMENKKTIEK